MSTTHHLGLTIKASLVVRNGLPSLAIDGDIYSPITWDQFKKLCQKASAEETAPVVVASSPQVVSASPPICEHRNAYGAACLKLKGHEPVKHQYVRKKYNRNKAKTEPVAPVPPADAKITVAKNTLTVDYKARGRKAARSFARRRKAGLCLSCPLRAETGKAYCKDHLSAARKRAAFMRAGKKA